MSAFSTSTEGVEFRRRMIYLETFDAGTDRDMSQLMLPVSLTSDKNVDAV